MFVLTIGIVLIAIMQVLALVLSFQKIPVVKAGDVDEVCASKKMKANLQASRIVVNGKSISTKGLKQYLVHGESMKPFGINDGQMVYVESVDASDLKNKDKYYPVAIFKYTSHNENDCDVKLRKFLTFVKLSEIDLDKLYEQYGKYLSIEDFKKEIDERIDEIKKEDSTLSGDYILSVTHRYKRNPAKYHYSIHNARKMQGVVKYVA